MTERKNPAVAGALFDLMGYLTTRGAALRGLDLDDADVSGWDKEPAMVDLSGLFGNLPAPAFYGEFLMKPTPEDEARMRADAYFEALLPEQKAFLDGCKESVRIIRGPGRIKWQAEPEAPDHPAAANLLRMTKLP